MYSIMPLSSILSLWFNPLCPALCPSMWEVSLAEQICPLLIIPVPNKGHHQLDRLHAVPTTVCLSPPYVLQFTAMEVVEYNPHYNAYQVQTSSPSTILLLQMHEFLDIYPLALNKTFSCIMQDASFVVLKYMYCVKG